MCSIRSTKVRSRSPATPTGPLISAPDQPRPTTPVGDGQIGQHSKRGVKPQDGRRAGSRLPSRRGNHVIGAYRGRTTPKPTIKAPNNISEGGGSIAFASRPLNAHGSRSSAEENDGRAGETN